MENGDQEESTMKASNPSCWEPRTINRAAAAAETTTNADGESKRGSGHEE